MTDILIEHIEWGVRNAYVWGFLLVFILMTIESSFVPFPSEIIMIPAAFMATRGELTTGVPHVDLLIVLICGLLGSLAGAYINYFLATGLGRPFLYRYGKYFFIKPDVLSRAEEIFLKYGELTTFICRLLPGIRQLISLPAGISRMPLFRFTFFTGLGAGLWSLILIYIGYYFGGLSQDMTYAQLVHRGKDLLKNNFIWIIAFILLIVCVYLLIHHMILKPAKKDEGAMGLEE
ncbi:DedA family protein [Thermodesulfobacteriota bacterium]